MLTTLRDKTQYLLNNRPRTVSLDDIAVATGLEKHWIKSFGLARSEDPGVCKVETLYTYLTGKSLDI